MKLSTSPKDSMQRLMKEENLLRGLTDGQCQVNLFSKPNQSCPLLIFHSSTTLNGQNACLMGNQTKDLIILSLKVIQEINTHHILFVKVVASLPANVLRARQRDFCYALVKVFLKAHGFPLNVRSDFSPQNALPVLRSMKSGLSKRSIYHTHSTCGHTHTPHTHTN